MEVNSINRLMYSQGEQLGRSDELRAFVFQVVDVCEAPLDIILGDGCVIVEKKSEEVDRVPLSAFGPSLTTGVVDVASVVVRCNLESLLKHAESVVADMIGDFPESEITLLKDDPDRNDELRREATRHFLNEIPLPYFIVSSEGFSRKLKNSKFEFEGAYGLVQVRVMPAVKAGIRI